MEFLLSLEGEGGGGIYKVAASGGGSAVLLPVFSLCQGSAIQPRERAPEPALFEAPLCVIIPPSGKGPFPGAWAGPKGLFAGVSSELVTLLSIRS